MKLQTPVVDERCKVGISYKNKITMLGSCFTENIGRQLVDFGFDALINPFGTLYNPISIKQSIGLLTSGRLFTEEDCVEMGAGAGLICSFSHHTSFARKTKEEFLIHANTELEMARKHFLESDRVIITLGTSWCFRHIGSDMTVSSCLKRPAAEFIRKRLSTEEVTQTLEQIAAICRDCPECAEKEFIFTVSPIRHFKDGAHGNQISKAALLVGTDDFITHNLCTSDYFPAYEIMMDELRDYRFYAEDMCHPSEQAVNYLCERFLTWALPQEERPMLEENIRALKRSRHIDFDRRQAI